MPVIKPIQTNFTTGEVAPYLDGRVDFDKYKGGLRTCTNAHITVAGGAVKRKGTKYLASTKNAGERVRLIPFIYDSDDSMVLEIGNGYTRFHDKLGLVTTGSPAAAVEVATPYENSVGVQELDEIQVWQSYDVLYFAHPNHPPCKLTRTSRTSWTWSILSAFDGPFLPDTHSGVTMTPSHASGTSRTLTASSATFASTWVGKIIRVYQEYVPSILTVTAANQYQSAHLVYGKFTVDISSLPADPFTGQITLQKSYNGTNYHDVATFYGSTLQEFFEPQRAVYYRCCCKTGHYTDGKALCTIHQEDYYAVCYITGYTSTTVVTVDIKQPFLGTGASYFWEEGAWGDNRGWPTTVCMHNDRLVFGGTAYQPVTIWGSWISDYECFTPGDTSEEAAFEFTLARLQDPIQWLYPWSDLVVGTLSEEATLKAPSGKTISPTTPPEVRLETNYGSAYSRRPQMVDKALVTTQLNEKKLRELTYSFAEDGYVAPDLTMLAPHIGEQRIRELAYCRDPHSSLFCLLSTGKVGVLSYNRKENVVAWSQWEFKTIRSDGLGGYGDGYAEVVSICSVPMSPQYSDGHWLYLAVRRAIGGSSYTYIERLGANDITYTSNPYYSTNYSTAEQHWYLDCSYTHNNPMNLPVTTITGLDHLENCYVRVVGYGDGGTTYIAATDLGAYFVSGGSITLDAADTNTRILVGMPYDLELKTMNLETAGEGVLGQGAIKRIINLKVRLLKAYGSLWFGATVATATKEHVIPASAVDATDSTDIEIPWKSGWDERGRIALVHSDPYPCHILALLYRCEVNP